MLELPFKDTVEFCKYVRKISHGSSFNQIFHEPGLDRANFSKYENGKCGVTLEVAIKILESVGRHVEKAS